jgi:regulator of replication initiation timing
MTKNGIITVMEAAMELLKIEDSLPMDFNTDAPNDIGSAQSALIRDLFDDVENIAVVLGALRDQPDQTQLRELIEENGRLKRELDAARNEKNAITITANKRIDEISHLQRELDAANEREAKMMVRIAELTPEPIEEEPDPDEEDEPEPVEAKPEKKKRAYHGSHRWTVEEDAWIANHLNSATNIQVAEKFGVTPKAAYLRMTIVRDRLGK